MLFKRYGLDASDLVFFMCETKTTSSEDDAPRHDRRRKYWSFALDMIHEAHGDCSFKNVHTTKSNYINGFIGVSGVCISCVANRDAARVEFCKRWPSVAAKFYDFGFMRRPIFTNLAVVDGHLGERVWVFPNEWW